MKNTFSSAAGVALLFGILIVFNALSQNLFSRFYVDLTEEKLYSLSSGTGNILKGLEQPVNLKFYYSKTDSRDLPILRILGERISNLLKEFERVGGGEVKLEIYDPRPDSEEADWAAKYGLSPIPLPTGQEIFFGLVGIGPNGQERAIPTFDLQRQEFLEYDITKLVYTLTQTNLPRVGILSSLDVRGREQQQAQAQQIPGQQPQANPWFFVKQLENYFKISYISDNRRILPSDLDLVVLVHPKGLSERLLYDLDQFVLKGGKLLVFVDPYCQADQPPQAAPGSPPDPSYKRSSDLNKLLAGWGVTMREDKVAADRELATQVRRSNAGALENFVPWLSLNSNHMSEEDVVTSALENITLPWSGVLDISEEADYVKPLFWSSGAGQELSATDYALNGGLPDALLRKVAYGGGRLNLAARIQGNLKTNFPDGVPQDASLEGEQSEEPIQSTELQSTELQSTEDGHVLESTQPSNVLVFADVDFITDAYSVQIRNFFGNQVAQRLNDNLSLILNATENLTGSSDLISIRTRGRFSRPFTKVEELQKKAELRWKNEEQLLTAKLQEANQRIQKFQQTSEGDSQILSGAVFDELQRFKDEKSETQAKLRKVRRSLREEVEGLGNKLFVINTFAVPFLIILLSLVYFFSKRKKLQSSND